MINLSVWVPEALAAAFDAAAAQRGGRAALLRRLVAEAAGADGGAYARAKGPPRSVVLWVRLTPADAETVSREATRMGLSRAAWTAGLVAARLRGRPTFSVDGTQALRSMAAELQRIGVGLHQVARTLAACEAAAPTSTSTSTSTPTSTPTPTPTPAAATAAAAPALRIHLDALESFRREIRQHLGGLREAVGGNLAYWDARR